MYKRRRHERLDELELFRQRHVLGRFNPGGGHESPHGLLREILRAHAVVAGPFVARSGGTPSGGVPVGLRHRPPATCDPAPRTRTRPPPGFWCGWGGCGWGWRFLHGLTRRFRRAAGPVAGCPGQPARGVRRDRCGLVPARRRCSEGDSQGRRDCPTLEGGSRSPTTGRSGPGWHGRRRPRCRPIAGRRQSRREPPLPQGGPQKTRAGGAVAVGVE